MPNSDRRRRELLSLFGKGFAMGLGDSVPGVSGGTIAVVTRIYEELIFSLRRLDLTFLRLLVQLKLVESWRHINGSFLLILALGMLSGLLLSANSVLYLLSNQFEALMAFFFGLILASVALLSREIPSVRWQFLAAALGGSLLTALIGSLEPAGASELHPVYLFFCGLVAVSAMILPGLSGAFILILLGAYDTMLIALTSFYWLRIGVFLAGCVAGLLLFSRLLSRLLRAHRALCFSAICGMLLGSLPLLWPWRAASPVDSVAENTAWALQSAPVWPLTYSETSGEDPQLLTAALCFLLGAALVLVLSRLASQQPEAR
jgi:putative membrane protein